MPLFGPPDVEKLKARTDVPGLIKTLGYLPLRNDSDKHVAMAAAQALVEIGEPAVDALVAAISDQGVHQRLRINAAVALGGIGGDRAIQVLVGVLREYDAHGGLRLGDREVKQAAVDALVKIGRPAIESLAGLTGKSGLEALERLRWSGGARSVNAAVRKAAQLPKGALKDPDRDVRKDAVAVLGRIGGDPAVRSLKIALKDPDRVVREAAAAALSQAGWSPDSGQAGAAYWVITERWDMCVRIGAPAVEPLIAALAGPDSVVDGAVSALARIGAPAVEPLIAALGDDDSNVRNAVAGALARIGAPAVEPLIAVLGDGDSSVRHRAAWTLGEIHDRRAVEPLVAALGDGDSRLRGHAASAVGKIGDARAVEPLIAALGDSDSTVRHGAAVALAEIGDRRAVEPLIAALNDSEELEVRRTAARWLVALYGSGRLDEAQKARLLARRGHIPPLGHRDREVPHTECHEDHEDLQILANLPI